MNKKTDETWLLFALLAMLVLGAVTGIPRLKQPDLVEPIVLLVLYLNK